MFRHKLEVEETGLTSAEAHQRLSTALQRLVTSGSSWKNCIKKPTFTLCYFFLTLALSLALFVSYAFQQVRRDVVLFEAILLLLVAALNCAASLWNAFLLNTWQCRQLGRRLAPCSHGPCPWGPSSYPSWAIQTARGHLTVPTWRDGAVVNLPTSLLVQGDVLQLQRDMVAPADMRLVEPGHPCIGERLDCGAVAPNELYELPSHYRQQATSNKHVHFVSEEKGLRFEVTSTPFPSLFSAALETKKRKTCFTKERDFVLCLALVVTLVVCAATFVLNLIRYLALGSHFGHWTEMLLELQVWAVVPLVQLSEPVLWSLVNTFCTSRVVLLMEQEASSCQVRRASACACACVWCNLCLVCGHFKVVRMDHIHIRTYVRMYMYANFPEK